MANPTPCLGVSVLARSVNDFCGFDDYLRVEIPRHWRLNQQRYRLVGEVDTDGQNPRFPPRFPPKYEVIPLPPITEEEQAIEDAEAEAFVAAALAYISGPTPPGGSQDIHAALDASTWKSGYLDPKAPWRRLERLKKMMNKNGV